MKIKKFVRALAMDLLNHGVDNQNVVTFEEQIRQGVNYCEVVENSTTGIFGNYNFRQSLLEKSCRKYQGPDLNLVFHPRIQ